MGLEKNIEKKVCKYAEEQGFLVFKFTSPGKRGVPDRLIIDPDGWPIFLEFKAPDKLPTKLQFYWMEQLAMRNIICKVIDDYDEGKRFIDDMVAARLSAQSDEPPAESGERGLILGPGTRKN